VLALGSVGDDPKKEWKSSGDGVLSFQCGVGRCALRDIWMGDDGRPAYRIPVPSLGKDEPSTVAEIAMHPIHKSE
jgi:hypothetical protein